MKLGDLQKLLLLENHYNYYYLKNLKVHSKM